MPNIRLQQELCDRGGVDHDRADSRSFRMTSAADVVALLKSAMRSAEQLQCGVNWDFLLAARNTSCRPAASASEPDFFVACSRERRWRSTETRFPWPAQS